MNDTVTHLMHMSREIEEIAALCADPMNSENELNAYRTDLHNARQRLQDELIKLFTPLSDVWLESLANRADEAFLSCNPCEYGTVSDPWCLVYGRILEAAHGITGETK